MDGVIDDLGVAGLRTSAKWVDKSIQLRGDDFLELVETARHINVPPIGQSESKIQSQAEEKVRAFVNAKKI